LVTVFAQVGVEEGQLLTARDDIVGIVEVQDEPARGPLEGGDEGVAEGIGQAHQIGAQGIGVVGIFIAAGVLQDPLPQQGFHGVAHVAGMATVAHRLFLCPSTNNPG
jgi:hypothetical protein